MVFVDRVQITVKAGDGGRGCLAFAQPPYTRHPYPDGGDGGDGGHVTLFADPNVVTLLDFHFRHVFTAERGGHGGSNRKKGRRGLDCLVRVPVGTIVQDANTQGLLRDLSQPQEQMVIAKGGYGGLGNATLADRSVPKRRSHSPKHRKSHLPKRAGSASMERNDAKAMLGGLGQSRQLVLELKLIADVGIIGFPNAGKSSLLARISTARPKVGDYPFTTRYPVLGVVQVGNSGSFIACDIPGLIEGAHKGKGLGFEFLRHIERTRLLIHLIDMSGIDERNPCDIYERLNQELVAYGRGVELKSQMVVANKMDMPQAKKYLEEFHRRYERLNIWPISCVTGAGIKELLQAAWHALQAVQPVSLTSSQTQ